MSTQHKFKTQIQKAEDLPNILSTQSTWHSIRECERSVFRSLDIALVAERKVNLIDAMDSEVKVIITDALKKGILVRHSDGTIAIQPSC
jgi:hypothetical protein